MLDSYAGWIGTVAAASAAEGESAAKKPTLVDGAARLAAIAGTSTCHIAQSKEGILVPGVVSQASYHDKPGVADTFSGALTAMPSSPDSG